MPYRIGLTGGVASGKSTVAGLFAQLGVDIIDADHIARELMARNTPVYHRVVDAFGAGVVRADGELDRAALRDLIFSDERRRHVLESIVHPEVRQQLLSAALTASSPYCVLVVPLLFEADMQDLVDRVLTVDVPDDIQRERLQRRDSLDARQAQAMMDSQLPRQRRLQLTDDIIDNSTTLAALTEQVTRLHRHYLNLAGQER